MVWEPLAMAGFSKKQLMIRSSVVQILNFFSFSFRWASRDSTKQKLLVRCQRSEILRTYYLQTNSAADPCSKDFVSESLYSSHGRRWGLAVHVDRRVGRLVFSDYNSASLLYYVSVLILLAFTTYVGLGVDDFLYSILSWELLRTLILTLLSIWSWGTLKNQTYKSYTISAERRQPVWYSY